MVAFRKLRSKFHDDWCSKCYCPMREVDRKLFMLPMMVGHYVSHSNPAYYQKNLVPVDCKADIPTGMYACGVIVYHCSDCGNHVVKLSIFLPVRDKEQYDDAFLFEHGELDDFLAKNHILF